MLQDDKILDTVSPASKKIHGEAVKRERKRAMTKMDEDVEQTDS
jgi:hypothetical protein